MLSFHNAALCCARFGGAPVAAGQHYPAFFDSLGSVVAGVGPNGAAKNLIVDGCIGSSCAETWHRRVGHVKPKEHGRSSL